MTCKRPLPGALAWGARQNSSGQNEAALWAQLETPTASFIPAQGTRPGFMAPKALWSAEGATHLLRPCRMRESSWKVCMRQALGLQYQNGAMNPGRWPWAGMKQAFGLKAKPLAAQTHRLAPGWRVYGSSYTGGAQWANPSTSEGFCLAPAGVQGLHTSTFRYTGRLCSKFAPRRPAPQKTYL